jgi:hypothetical protein
MKYSLHFNVTAISLVLYKFLVSFDDLWSSAILEIDQLSKNENVNPTFV